MGGDSEGDLLGDNPLPSRLFGCVDDVAHIHGLLLLMIVIDTQRAGKYKQS